MNATSGTVVKITAFGAFVSLLPGKDGLLHISKTAPTRWGTESRERRGCAQRRTEDSGGDQ